MWLWEPQNKDGGEDGSDFIKPVLLRGESVCVFISLSDWPTVNFKTKFNIFNLFKKFNVRHRAKNRRSAESQLCVTELLRG